MSIDDLQIKLKAGDKRNIREWEKCILPDDTVLLNESEIIKEYE